ncbi:hypothetical protein [Robbsia andropogonis]|uniref:hypothetical protein n=1 Tax=Robbsia andropogonis TaxID=28092 RepID=UPI002A6AEBA3|nr:hypothetical protein [Robbsia andropogonis]
MATNPMVTQGTLNRVRTHVVCSDYTSLNVTSSYMGRSFARLAFEGDFNQLIGTGTSAVTSPEPYVFATLTLNLLRTQALSQSWMTQAQSSTSIGDVTAYSDASTFDAVTLSNCVIRSIDPGAYDGTDPVVRVELRGLFYVNDDMWSY